MRNIGFSREIDFIGNIKLWGTVSITAVSLCLLLIMFKGLSYGIDFSGGTEMQVRFSDTVKVDNIRDSLVNAGFKNSNVQSFGSQESNEYLLRVQMEEVSLSSYEEDLRQAITRGIKDKKLLNLRFAGDNVYVTFDQPVEVVQLQNAIKTIDITEASLDSVKQFGKEVNNEYHLRFKGATKRIEEALIGSFGQGKFEIRRVEAVGAKVGKELRNSGMLAILVSLFFILVYIGFRFDFTYAPGAVACLFHDVIIIVGIFSMMGKEFSLTIVAALLTLVGYSLNDTIVVFDRIRENIPKMSAQKVRKTVNISINQTLSRTLLTSITTLLVTIPLLILGGQILHNFAFALTLGVIIGTYSSIFVASPLYILMEEYQQRRTRG